MLRIEEQRDEPQRIVTTKVTLPLTAPRSSIIFSSGLQGIQPFRVRNWSDGMYVVKRTFDPRNKRDLTPFYRAKPTPILVTQLFQKEGPTCAEPNSSLSFCHSQNTVARTLQITKSQSNLARAATCKKPFSFGHRLDIEWSYPHSILAERKKKKVAPLPLLQGGSVSLSRSSMDSGLRGVQPLSNRWWLGGRWLFSQPQMPIVWINGSSRTELNCYCDKRYVFKYNIIFSSVG